MYSTTINADEDSISDGSPGWILGTTVKADFVALS